MTDLNYRYLARSRTLQDCSKRYAGQQCDSGATTLRFSYDPLNYLELNDWTAYIIFNVMGPDGNPMVFGPNSPSRFDGYTFDLPWDVTSRVKQARVEFQLWLVKADIEIDDATQLPSLESTDYELSTITGIALKPSIMGKRRCDPGCPPLPTTEPTLMGLMQVFMEYGVVRPVKAVKNEEERCYELVFRSYNGGEDTVKLDIPWLDEDGNVDASFLPIINEWFSEDGELQATDSNLPSALLTYDALNGKTDKVMAIPDWDAESTYSAGSTVIGSDGRLYISLQDANIGLDPTLGTGWRVIIDESDLTGEDGRFDIPQMEDIQALLDLKFDKIDVINAWNDEPSTTQVPSEALVLSKVAESLDGIVSNEWGDPFSTERAPSEALARSEIDKKTDKTMAIPEWDAEETYEYMATVVYEGQIYISRQPDNRDRIPSADEVWWTPISCTGGGCSSGCSCSGPYVAIIGDGTNTEFTVAHGLGSENVLVELRDVISRRYVRSTIQVVDSNTIRVTFRNPPTSDGIVVVVTDMMCNTNIIVETIGNGTDTHFEITHNWGTYNVFSQFRMNDGTGLLVFADVTAINPAQVALDFAEPPAQDQIIFYMVPCISDCTFTSYTHTQTTPSDEWVINHNLNRVVAVYTMDLDGEEMSAYVRQDMATLNSVTIQFSEPVTGVAYIR